MLRSKAAWTDINQHRSTHEARSDRPVAVHHHVAKIIVGGEVVAHVVARRTSMPEKYSSWHSWMAMLLAHKCANSKPNMKSPLQLFCPLVRKFVTQMPLGHVNESTLNSRFTIALKCSTCRNPSAKTEPRWEQAEDERGKIETIARVSTTDTLALNNGRIVKRSSRRTAKKANQNWSLMYNKSNVLRHGFGWIFVTNSSLFLLCTKATHCVSNPSSNSSVPKQLRQPTQEEHVYTARLFEHE